MIAAKSINTLLSPATFASRLTKRSSSSMGTFPSLSVSNHHPSVVVGEDGVMPSSPHGSLPDRLERVAVQFEADHPTLAASARRLVDLLGEVGI